MTYDYIPIVLVLMLNIVGFAIKKET